MPMKPSPLPPLRELRSVFHYDPITGHLTNKVSRTSRKAGDRAESLDKKSGYLRVYFGRLIYAHRVAWALGTGQDAPEWIDHINGDQTDNRLCNLRPASNGENMQNRVLNKNSTTRAKGVYKRSDNGLWRAHIAKNGKRIWLGTFETFDEANSVVISARERLHGKFARNK